VLQAEQHAKDVRIEYVSVGLGSLVGDRSGRSLGAGDIDRDVEASEPLHRFIYQAADIVLVSHIGALEFSLTAEVAEFSDQLLAFITVPAGDDEARSFVCESQGRGATDAG
jgi:hypothetical protein